MSATSSLNPTKLRFTTDGNTAAVEITASQDQLTFNDGAATVSLRNISNPVENTDAATKAYVDGLAQGLDIKTSVRVATTFDGGPFIPLTIVDGTVVDGITVELGDRVLVKNEQIAADNGIYVIGDDQVVGGVTRSTTRAADLSAGNAAGSFTFVESGATQADTGWVCTADTGSAEIGIDALSFTQFSGTGALELGNNMLYDGPVLRIVDSPLFVGAVTAATGSIFGNITVADGSITTSGDAISFGNAGLTTSGVISATQITATSDARLKEDVTTITGGLDLVGRLRGVRFEWKDPAVREEGGSQMGVIAQETEMVLPELVRTDANGMKSVDYDKISAVLIEAMKELSDDVRELQAEVISSAAVS